MSHYVLKKFDENFKKFIYFWVQNAYDVSKLKINERESCIKIHAHFPVDSQMDDFSVI